MSPEKMAEMTELASGVTEIVHKVATRRLVQTIEFVCEEEIAPLRKALQAILDEPHGCRFCDSGKLRNAANNHDSWWWLRNGSCGS